MVIKTKDLVEYKMEKFKEEFKRITPNSNKKSNITALFLYNSKDLAGVSYVKSKDNLVKKAGIDSYSVDVSDYTPEEIKNIVDFVNKNKIPTMFQRPMATPEQEVEAMKLIPEVDIDGFGDNSLVLPCTVWGVLEIIKNYFKISEDEWNSNKPLHKYTITVVGRGKLIGEKLCKILLDKGATLVAMNSGTKSMFKKNNLIVSDIVVLCTDRVCINQNDLVLSKIVNHLENTLVIDCGIMRGEDGKLHGCIEPETNLPSHWNNTAVPGGVGPMTVLGVVNNVLELCKSNEYIELKEEWIEEWKK